MIGWATAYVGHLRRAVTGKGRDRDAVPRWSPTLVASRERPNEDYERNVQRDRLPGYRIFDWDAARNTLRLLDKSVPCARARRERHHSTLRCRSGGFRTRADGEMKPRMR